MRVRTENLITTKTGMPGTTKGGCQKRVRAFARFVLCAFSLAVTTFNAGCGSNIEPSSDLPPNIVNKYLALGSSQITIDRSPNVVSRRRTDGKILQSGTFSMTSRGFLNITLAPTVQPVPGSWAVEIPGHGGLLRLRRGNESQDVLPSLIPLAPSDSCPSIADKASFLFVTAPNLDWTKNVDGNTAYGTVDIGTSGSTVNFSNILQLTLTGRLPSTPWSSTAVGGCAASLLGNTISVPPSGAPAPPPPATAPPSATLGIGPSGFLVEDNGFFTSESPQRFSNLLGAGLGAVGLIRPSTPLNTSEVAGAQYLGFIHQPHLVDSEGRALVNIASFGWQGSQNPQNPPPAACQSRTGTNLIGGDFPGNPRDNDVIPRDDPSSSTYGNFNYCIDLGPQSDNGLYRSARVFQGDGAGPFTGVAVVGRIGGKYAIFVLATQPAAPCTPQPSCMPPPSPTVAIYLFQDPSS